MLTTKEARQLLADECEKAGGYRAWAEKHEILGSNVYAVIHGGRPIEAKIMNALNLKYIAMYERIET